MSNAERMRQVGARNHNVLVSRPPRIRLHFLSCGVIMRSTWGGEPEEARGLHRRGGHKEVVMKTQALVFDEGDSDRELAALHPDLTSKGFGEVLQAGVVALADTTDNDSPCWRGGQPRGFMIRKLRDWLCPKEGWTKSDTLNLALVENARAGISIAITPGDSNTGRRGTEDPKSRNPRGEVTIGRVALNQMTLFDQFDGPGRVIKPSKLYVFLFNINFRDGIATSEVSLPYAVGSDDRIVGWSKRILVPKIDLSAPMLSGSLPEDEPAEDVAVHRKE